MPKRKNPIPVALRSLTTKLDELQPDPHNTRKHDARNMEAVRRSLDRFGWRTIVVARKSDKVILAGNARVAAAKELGWTDGPVVFVNDDKSTGTAYAIADNRTAELAEWDIANLTEAIAEMSVLEDSDLLDVVGFDDAELEALLPGVFENEGEPGEAGDPVESGTLGTTQYMLVVEELSEKQQGDLMERLQKEGFKCRVLMS